MSYSDSAVLGDGVADPAGGLVAVNGQGRSLATRPGLAQHVREQGKRGRLALHVTDQQVDQARLQPEAGPSGRAFDGAAQVGLVHRAQEVQALFEDPRDVGVRRQVAEVVGPQREHQGAAGGDMRGQGSAVADPVLRVLAHRDDLLGLIHHERLLSMRPQPAQRLRSVVPRAW